MSAPPGLRRQALAAWRTRLREARGRLGGRFVQPVLTLVSGVAAAQALTYLARPLLTRLYGPEEFGVLTLFVALVSLVGAGATGRYEDALMLPARRADAARLLLLSLAVGTGTGVGLSLLLPWREALATALDTPALAPALWLLPATGVAVAAGQTLEVWHTRADRYRVVAAGRVAQAVVVVGIQVAAGLTAAGALGLTFGVSAGFAALLVPSLLVLLRRDRLLLLATLRAPEWGRMARRYRRFPAFTAPAALLNLFAARVPVLALAAAFGPAPTGLFGVAFGALALPVGMVTGSVGQVFFVRAAEAQRNGTLGPLTRRTLRHLLVLSVYPIAAAAVAGPPLFAWVFGPEWAEAGTYARLLAPWLVLSVVVPPLTRVFDVAERQRADLAFSVVQAAGLGLALLVAARLGDVRTAVATAGVAGAGLRLLHLGWILHIARTPLGGAAADALRVLAGAAPFLAAGAAAGWLTGSVVVTVAVLALGGAGHLALALRHDRAAARG